MIASKELKIRSPQLNQANSGTSMAQNMQKHMLWTATYICLVGLFWFASPNTQLQTRLMMIAFGSAAFAFSVYSLWHLHATWHGKSAASAGFFAKVGVTVYLIVMLAGGLQPLFLIVVVWYTADDIRSLVERL